MQFCKQCLMSIAACYVFFHLHPVAQNIDSLPLLYV
jgi:hypothetical protein